MCWLDNVRQSSALFGQPEQSLHIGNTGSDIYELLCLAKDVGTHFIFRTCADWLAVDRTHMVATYIRQVRCRGLYRVEVRDSHAQCRCAVLELRNCGMQLLLPRAKQTRYLAITPIVLQAAKRDAPSNVEPIEWKLITGFPVHSRADAIEKLHWHAMRWKIEPSHKILKSSCDAEDSRLRTAQRLTNLIAVFCIFSWRIFWLMMINRAAPSIPATLAFALVQVDLLDRLAPAAGHHNKNRPTSSNSPTKPARLGAYLSRALDPPARQYRHLARHGAPD